MGIVVDLKWSTCPCGWQHPANIDVTVEDGEPVPALAEILYDCPQCGQGVFHVLNGRKPTVAPSHAKGR